MALSPAEKQYLEILEPYLKKDEDIDFHQRYLLNALELGVEEVKKGDRNIDTYHVLLKELQEIIDLDVTFPEETIFENATRKQLKDVLVERLLEVGEVKNARDSMSLSHHDGKWRITFFDSIEREEFASFLELDELVNREILDHVHYSNDQELFPRQKFFLDLSPKEITDMDRFAQYLADEYEFDLPKVQALINIKPDRGLKR